MRPVASNASIRRIAVCASGAGSTFAALADARDRSGFDAEVVCLLVSRPGTAAIELARGRGIDHVVIDERAIGAPAADRAMYEALESRGVGIVVLAGYLHKIGPLTLRAFAGQIVNTHPAPLPRFGGPGMYGEHVHRAVLASGVAMSAATLHLVDAEYDTGPVLASRPVPVRAGDDVARLRARVQVAERALLLETIIGWDRGAAGAPLPDPGPA